MRQYFSKAFGKSCKVLHENEIWEVKQNEKWKEWPFTYTNDH